MDRGRRAPNRLDIREDWVSHLYIIAIYYCHQRSDREFLKKDLQHPTPALESDMKYEMAVALDKFDFSRPHQG